MECYSYKDSLLLKPASLKTSVHLVDLDTEDNCSEENITVLFKKEITRLVSVEVVALSSISLIITSSKQRNGSY